MSKRIFGQHTANNYWYIRIFLWLFCFFNCISLAIYFLLRFGFSEIKFTFDEELYNVMKVMGIATAFAVVIMTFMLLTDGIDWIIKRIKRHNSLAQ